VLPVREVIMKNYLNRREFLKTLGYTAALITLPSCSTVSSKPEEEVLALCGYRCDLCQFYTKNIKSEKDKERVSKDFNRIFGYYVKPEDVECVGCKNEGKHIESGCTVRPCALKKGVENCAHCSGFICDKLERKMDVMENFLKSNKKPLSEEDFQLYIKPYQSRERLLEIRKKIKTT
jgi:hypothetical protein